MADDVQSINLTNQFLIAMPGMDDGTFTRSVVYVCEHSERGALGLIINKPGDISLADLFERVDLPLRRLFSKGGRSRPSVASSCMSRSWPRGWLRINRSTRRRWPYPAAWR